MLGTKDNPNDMTAATMSIIRVVSCKASHTSSKKDFGGLGGITFEPYFCFRSSRFDWLPERPVNKEHIGSVQSVVAVNLLKMNDHA